MCIRNYRRQNCEKLYVRLLEILLVRELRPNNENNDRSRFELREADSAKNEDVSILYDKHRKNMNDS